MRHFPIFVDLGGQRVVVAGARETAVAKLRLILKTGARVAVFGADPADQVVRWATEGRLVLHRRALQCADLEAARLAYAATDLPDEDARISALARAAGVLVNVVDNLEASDFITPAIVDRDPVTVAIGTEGTSPVLARRIKAEIEERLPAGTGLLARLAAEFRGAVEALPAGRVRRRFWDRFFGAAGPRALSAGGEVAVRGAMKGLLDREAAMGDEPGHVSIIGAGPGDPDLLTMKARRVLSQADVVIHDRLVPQAVLELARREAVIIEAGKAPGGTGWRQEDINALMVDHAAKGAHVARLKSGDPTIYGRLDEEMDALDAAGIAFEIVPGVTSAVAAAAAARVSLTRRRRNSSIRFLTGQDVDGFAEQDWRALARPGATAAVYMGVRAARFLKGRLIMHGTSPETPVSVIENVSRPGQKVVATPIGALDTAMDDAGVTGPAILFLGLTPRTALARLDRVSEPLPVPLPEPLREPLQEAF